MLSILYFHLHFSMPGVGQSLCSPRTPSAHGLAQKPEAMHKYFQQLSLSLPCRVMQWGMLHNPMEVPQKYNPPPVPLCSQLSDPWQTLWIALKSAKGEEVKVLSLKFKCTERQTLAFILEMRSWITPPFPFFFPRITLSVLYINFMSQLVAEILLQSRTVISHRLSHPFPSAAPQCHAGPTLRMSTERAHLL